MRPLQSIALIPSLHVDSTVIEHYVRSTSNCDAENKCWRQENARRRFHCVNCCDRDAVVVVCGAKPDDIAAPPCRLVPVAAVVAVTLLPPALGAAIGASALAALALLVLESTARAVLLLLESPSHSEAQAGLKKRCCATLPDLIIYSELMKYKNTFVWELTHAKTFKIVVQNQITHLHTFFSIFCQLFLPEFMSRNSPQLFWTTIVSDRAHSNWSKNKRLEISFEY